MPGGRAYHAALVGVAIAILVIAQPGVAYQRTMTCRVAGTVDPRAPTASPICRPDESPWPLSWPTPQLVVRVSDQAAARAGLPQDAFLQVIAQGLEAWSQVDCASFTFELGALTPVQRHDPRDGQHVISVLDEQWPYTRTAFAVTSTTASARGQMVDSDMELNAQVYAWTLDAAQQPDRVDLLNTVTHEAGHMLGLDHTIVELATMFADAGVGEVSKRALHEDDREGLCAIYPASQAPPVPSSPEPSGCCAQVSGAGRPVGGPWWGLGVASLVGLGRVRAKRQRQRR